MKDGREMQLKSDYYDTDFTFTYKGNTILIRNDGPEGESLFVNGVLQDRNYSAHNGHLIGHIFDEENRKEVIEVFLGGTETRHCMVYANGAIIHADVPPIVPDAGQEKGTSTKAKKKHPYFLTLVLVIILAIVAGVMLHYTKPSSPAATAGADSGGDGGTVPAAAGAETDDGAANGDAEGDRSNEGMVLGPSDSERYIEVNYTWDYGRDHWSYKLSIPESLYNYYKTIDRKKIKSYGYYVTDPTDDEYLSSLAEKFREAAKKGNYSDYDMVKNIIFFVQNLNYVDDKVGTGYDEYPKFPLETLADEGGDCEDSAILLASLLRELGYGTVLVQFEDHMGVGLKGEETIPGSYFEVDGDRYYYVETTSPGWDIGEVPEEMMDRPAKILKLN